MVVLMDHADAIGEGILRGTYGDFLTVGIDLSFVRLIYTAEHIHKGSLSTSVFAQEGKNLPSSDIKGNAIIGNYLAKSLGYPLQFNCASFLHFYLQFGNN